MAINISAITNKQDSTQMIPIYKPYFTGRERIYVNECLDSTWISSKGPFIGKFERRFADFIGAKHATSVSNGTVALHLALEALGVGPGDEVIVPTLTYIASVNTIIQCGATPIFVDSLQDTWQIDPNDVLQKITPKTKAVMAVHLYGLPCDMDALTSICKQHNLYLIEDCAEAFGSYYKNQHVGTFGDISTFSFFGNKTITTGEGGMVVARDESILNKAFHLKNQGVSKEKEYWHDVVAYNYRMTNICAAIGLAQLEDANNILTKKRAIANWYREGLQNLPLKTHNEIQNTTHSFWMCSILLDKASMRNSLRTHLKSAGIETRPVFFPSNAMPHCKTDDFFCVAEKISSAGINLPSWPGLTKDMIDSICHNISLFFQENQ
jgi:perosamine synthetase